MEDEVLAITGIVTEGLWGEYNRILQIFQSESDRAAAVLAAAFLDASLGDLLRAYFIDATVVDRLFTHYGPAATFSARIDLLYALGFVPEEAKRDLGIIRKIRNYFAHHPDETRFDGPPVRDWCSSLSSAQKYEAIDVQNKQPAKGQVTEPRDQYVLAIASALSSIEHYIQTSRRRVVPSSTWEQ